MTNQPMTDQPGTDQPGTDRPVRVMVVDDHPMWRDAVSRDLAEAGLDVVATAGDGEEAVRRARACSPQVVVLDLNLPGLPGAEVCRQVVAHDQAVRVLVLSASGEHQDVLEAVKSGATGYLVKSAGREELLDAVRRTAVGDAVFTPGLAGAEVCRQVVAHDQAVRVLVLSASGEHQDVLEAVKSGATGYLVKSAGREELLDAVRRTAVGDAVFTPGLAGLVLGEFRRLAAEPAQASAPAVPQLTARETEVLRLVAKGLSYRQIADRLVLSHRTVQNHVQNTLGKLQLHNRVELVRYAIERGLDEEL